MNVMKANMNSERRRARMKQIVPFGKLLFLDSKFKPLAPTKNLGPTGELSHCIFLSSLALKIKLEKKKSAHLCVGLVVINTKISGILWWTYIAFSLSENLICNY